jgi:hypothetical protein
VKPLKTRYINILNYEMDVINVWKKNGLSRLHKLKWSVLSDSISQPLKIKIKPLKTLNFNRYKMDIKSSIIHLHKLAKEKENTDENHNAFLVIVGLGWDFESCVVWLLAVDADHVRVSWVVLETTKHFIVWENYDSWLGHLGIVDVIPFSSICNNWLINKCSVTMF